jgi:hypothetical protein
MYAYMDKKKLLREPSEKRRRLEEVPQVIPDMKDSKDTESLVPPEDKSIQNNAVVFQGDTAAMDQILQITAFADSSSWVFQ